MWCLLAIDVTQLSQCHKIEEIWDLGNAILADVVDFGYQKNAVQTMYAGELCIQI